jgi:DNA polymerase-4
MDRFHGCYQWTNELSQSITKEGLPLSFALSVNKTVSWNRRIKTNRKIRDSRNHGKTFLNRYPSKIPMVGDVTFQLLSRIGIHYSDIIRNARRSAATNDW